MIYRVDLHSHGPIGLQPEYLEIQGYRGKNLLRSLVDSCLGKGVNICALISTNVEIPAGSVWDKFGNFVNYARRLPKEYSTDKIGKNILSAEVGGKRFYLLNGQEIEALESGRIVHHLVIGSNQIPSLMSLKETIKHCNNEGLIQIAAHPFCTSHFGVGKELLERHLEGYDAIEGHNSHMILPSFFHFAPFLGSFSKRINSLAQQFAEKEGKPWIAATDAHRIEDAGLAYIEFDRDIRTTNDEALIADLREVIRSGEFRNECIYARYLDMAGWIIKGGKMRERVKGREMKLLLSRRLTEKVRFN